MIPVSKEKPATGEPITAYTARLRVKEKRSAKSVRRSMRKSKPLSNYMYSEDHQQELECKPTFTRSKLDQRRQPTKLWR